MQLYLCVSFVVILGLSLSIFLVSLSLPQLFGFVHIRHVEIKIVIIVYESGDSCAFVLKVLTIWHSASKSNWLHCVEFACISVGG